MKTKKLSGGLLLALLCALPACATLLHSSPEEDESRQGEPPKSWASAVNFQFQDRSTFEGVDFGLRIEFHDGVRNRVITARDLFTDAGNRIRTPWYRFRTSATTIRVVLDHPGGDSTVAEYPLSVKRDEFYYVTALVYKREPAPNWGPPNNPTYRAYPLHPNVRAQPGDSLWIGYYTNGRYCFNCPS